MSPSSRTASLILALVALATLLAAPASAHANYFASEPAKGARLDVMPETVVVELTEHLDPSGSGLEVRDGDGERVDDGEVSFEERGAHTFVSVGIRDGVGDGVYVATWKALSTVDGHVTKGSWSFAVGGFEPPTIEAEAESWEVPSALSRAVLYAGFALAFGALAFLLFIDPQAGRGGDRRLLGIMLLSGTLLQTLGIVGLLLETWRQTGISFVAFASGTDVGTGLVVRLATTILAVGVAASVLAMRGDRRLMNGAVAFLLVATAWGASQYGHASVAGRWPIVVDWVHLVSASVWMGGLGIYLVYIIRLGRRRDATGIRVVGFRFSGVALTAVILLGLTGTINSVVILGPAIVSDPTLLLEHRYGGFLAAKIGLTTLMVVLAAINRYMFLGDRPGPDDTADPDPDVAWRRVLPEGPKRTSAFARTVSIEAVFGVAVLVCAGFLTALSPPADIAAASGPEPLQVSREGDDFNVTLFLRPPPVAQAEANLTLLIWKTEDREPLTNATRVIVDIIPEDDDGTGAERHQAVHDDEGLWVVGDVLFPQPGDFTVKVSIQTPFVYLEEIGLPITVAEADA